MTTEESGGRARSTKGCWTCRIRHKKCDEATPSCSECKDRDVKCHGYGARPAWMDGRSRERAERFRIKVAVRNSWMRSRASRKVVASSEHENLSTERSPPEPPLLESSTTPGDDTLENRRNAVLSSPDILPELEPTSAANQEANASPQQWCQTPADDLGQPHAPTSSEDVSFKSSGTGITYREADSLMHYLDYVFPRQFPFSSIDPQTGRGWLFWLLMKNNPLYQAALSLSALHQYLSQPTRVANRWDELNKHHIQAIRELQHFLGANMADGLSNKQQVVEVLACGTSLISFEVFRGGIDGWKPHLNGLTSVLSTSWSQASANDQGSTPTSPATLMSSSHAWVDTAFRFLAGVVLWFDILACISTAEEPRTPYKSWLGEQDVDISNVMGCQNWAMLEIGNLAYLNAWKLAAGQAGTLSMQELVARGHEIESRIEQGVRTLDLDEQAHLQRDSAAITHVFALAALVQLHAIVSGPYPGIPELRNAVNRAVLAIGDLAKSHSLRGFVWPLCVTGCMAEPCHQPFFDSLISDALDTTGRDLGNLGTTLQIMRLCWKKRESSPLEGWDWGSAMKDLDIGALLI